MSNPVYLDPETTSELEPSEKVPNGSVRISPFSVPDTIEVAGPAPLRVSRLRFGYFGGETGDLVERLDSQNNPAVRLLIGRATRKVLEIQFEPATDADGLRRVVKRLRRRTGRVSPIAKRFSYMMVERVLTHFMDQIIEASKAQPERELVSD
jgi:hypothetical protein